MASDGPAHTTRVPPQPAPPPQPRWRRPDLDLVRRRVDGVLDAFVDRKTSAARLAGLPDDVPVALTDFLRAGGKRIRPLLCVLGWQAAGGTGERGLAQAVRVGAALEMFHAFCLVHDDVMDDSDTRRGQPTVHRALAARYRAGRTRDLAEAVGTSAAILTGDLALLWSDELLQDPADGLDPDRYARIGPLVALMREEVMYGQCLDLIATGLPTADTEPALTVIRYKTAKYTCERPLQIGAALAGADEALQRQLSAFALPLGEAFQLRDDVLGAFGHPEQTGKPALDDLREGKHTVLVSLAYQAATPARAPLLHALYGNPRLSEEDARTLRALLRDTGADRAVERMIAERHERAVAVLDGLAIPAEVREQLRALADKVAWRTS
ncbi:polyprenyl synthetase family protein [Kitasatospora brasiliensis]|uniref:polyprenyl synthetase family protein n=1 Tax=Kitasatospora brasiliensis TaxID=3058040 RepID=UPI0029310F6F|nr:polyprenyl synthetase family protein [Kitasatospora sp. K002]